jgi:hypothetical protein
MLMYKFRTLEICLPQWNSYVHNCESRRSFKTIPFESQEMGRGERRGADINRRSILSGSCRWTCLRPQGCSISRCSRSPCDWH